MAFYSFKVWSPGEVVLPKYLVVLGAGNDVFNATVQELDEIVAALESEGVRILEVTRLDDLEHVPPDPDVQAALTGQVPPELVALGYSPSFMEDDHGLRIQAEEAAFLGAEMVRPGTDVLS